MFILFITAFNMFLSFSMLFPIFPAYVKMFGGSPVHVGTLIAIQPFLQLILAPFWGRLSDRYGRKLFISLGMFGYSISFFLTALATNVPFIYFARILGGIISASAIPTILAYVSDITEGKERNVGMGIVGAGFGLGVVFGPFVGGFLGHIDLRTAFFISSFVSLLNAVFVYTYLKEPERKFIRKRIPVQLDRTVILLILSNAVITFAMTSMEGILSIMLKYRYDMDVLNIGLIIGVAGISGALTQGSMRMLVKRFSEKLLIITGMLFMATSIVLVIFVNRVQMYYLLMVIYGIGAGLTSPNLSAYFSKKVLKEHIGAYMGMFQSGGSLGRILGPSLGAYMYQIHFAIPYAIDGFLLIAMIILFLIWL